MVYVCQMIGGGDSDSHEHPVCWVAALCLALGHGPTFIHESDPHGHPVRRARSLRPPPGNGLGSGYVQTSQLLAGRCRTQTATASSCLKRSRHSFTHSPLTKDHTCSSCIRKEVWSPECCLKGALSSGALSQWLLRILLRGSLRSGPSCARCTGSPLQLLPRRLPVPSTVRGPARRCLQPPESPGTGAGGAKVASAEHFPVWHQEGRVGLAGARCRGLLCILRSKQLSPPQVWKRSGAWFYKGLPKYILPLKTPGRADDPHLRPLPVEPTEQEPRSTETSRVYTWARGRGKTPLPPVPDSS